MAENEQQNHDLTTPHVLKTEQGEQLIPSPPHQQLEPVPSNERLGVMDALRGFALIGILMMNIEWFNRPVAELGQFDTSLNGVDYAASWFVKVFVEGKFYKLFALLFGMGFAVMLIKAQQSAKQFNSMFVRRMGALFLFGMAHYIFLWDGDILHDYAIGGLILLGWVQLTRTKRFSRFSKPTSFMKFGLSILLLPVIIMLFIANYLGMTRDNDTKTEAWSERQEIVSLSNKLFEEKKQQLNSSLVSPPDYSDKAIDDMVNKIEAIDPLALNNQDNTENQTESLDNEEDEDVDVDLMSRQERIDYLANKRAESKIERLKDANKEIVAVTDSHFLSGAKLRLESAGKAILQAAFFSFLMLVPIFMLGYWLVASGAINNTEKHPYLFKSLAWVGIIIGMGITTASLHILQSPITEDTTYISNSAWTLFEFSQDIMSAGYLGLIVCLYQSKFWQRILNLLAPLGRMALTNYISHSIILSSLFYGFGFGMFGQVSRGPQMLIVAVIIFSQIIISTIWLKHFRFGPLEWLWRCMTYKKIQPMKL